MNTWEMKARVFSSTSETIWNVGDNLYLVEVNMNLWIKPKVQKNARSNNSIFC